MHTVIVHPHQGFTIATTTKTWPMQQNKEHIQRCVSLKNHRPCTIPVQPLNETTQGNTPTPLRLLISASIPTLSGGHNPFFSTWIPLNALHGSMITAFHHLDQKISHLTHCELLTMYCLHDTSICITAVAGTDGVGWYTWCMSISNHNTLWSIGAQTTNMSNIEITPHIQPDVWELQSMRDSYDRIPPLRYQNAMVFIPHKQHTNTPNIDIQIQSLLCVQTIQPSTIITCSSSHEA